MATPQAQPVHINLDPWMASVTVIENKSNGLASQACNLGSATGFFYQKGNSRYLITNRHVVVNEQNCFYPDSLVLRVHLNTGNISQNRNFEIPLYNVTRQPLWLEHPTFGRNVDVVAIKIDNYIQPNDLITFLSAANIMPSNVILNLGDPVLVMGYPMTFYDTVHNLPITKSGTIASPYGVPFMGKPHFLIDANLQPGTSGSPVILPSSTFRRFSGGQTGIGIGVHPPHLIGINSGEYFVNSVTLGLHITWYASLIEEIIPTPTPILPPNVTPTPPPTPTPTPAPTQTTPTP